MPQQVTSEIPECWCVFQWGQFGGFYWRFRPWHKGPRLQFNINSLEQDSIVHVIDPLTAIGLGLVTPEELNFPPGILAAFNLLSKEPS